MSIADRRYFVALTEEGCRNYRDPREAAARLLAETMEDAVNFYLSRHEAVLGTTMPGPFFNLWVVEYDVDGWVEGPTPYIIEVQKRVALLNHGPRLE